MLKMFILILFEIDEKGLENGIFAVF